MYLDFLGVCFDQILNQAAKLRFMTGGKARMGLVIRTQFGGGRSSGSQHSQSLEALLAHVPGLTVVMPSTPADTYGLLRSAILDPNPVVFIENRQQYGMKGPKPPADYLIPLGKAKVVRAGTDLTIVSVSRMVHEALAAAEALAPRGISAEVIDLRTVAPLDRETILASLAKTNRLLIAHEGVTDFGIGAEIAALAAYQGFWTLDAPVRRVAPPPTPSPYAPNLEKLWLPDRQAIERAAEELVRVLCRKPHPFGPHFIDEMMAECRRRSGSTAGTTPLRSSASATPSASHPLAADRECVIHGDPGPFNTIFRKGLPIALIDWSSCRPGGRLEDLGYMAWTCAIPGSRRSAASMPAQRSPGPPPTARSCAIKAQSCWTCSADRARLDRRAYLLPVLGPNLYGHIGQT
jgi:pyruvate/2-oxoglutarate/acetoin dehydrogenase E1 component